MNSWLGTANNRQVFYISQEQIDDSIPSVANKNWLLFAIADNSPYDQLKGLAKICLDNGVLYICGAGDAGSEIDDAFDWEMVMRKIESGDDNYDDTPMTIWDTDFDNGFWFTTTVASHDTLIIDIIVCINLTPVDYRTKIGDLINAINDGWLPD